MKRNTWTIALTAMMLIGGATGFAQDAPAAKTFDNDVDRFSYALGCQVGVGLKGNLGMIGLDLNFDVLVDALRVALEGKEAGMDQAAIMQAMKDMDTVASEARAGAELLAKNATAEGVVVTASGLQYKVLTPGTGASPTSLKDTVSVNYVGTLVNGHEFDSSYKRGKPSDFEVGKVVAGWTEALQLMKEGGKWKLWIPYELAYGEQGRQRSMPGKSTLVFEVELLSVTPAPVGSDVVLPNASSDTK
jgi:FKBP-type peptidyl-prolyl cis-trans isomerase